MRYNDGVVSTVQDPTARPKPTIVGRSSSHFTRTLRIFAWEMGVDHAFRPVRDMMSHDASSYAGNPALKLPILETETGPWFGALNICREVSRRSERALNVVWPEDLDRSISSNAQELVTQAMATEVSLIMGGLGGRDPGDAYVEKMRRSLLNTISWLDEHLPEVLALLPPERDLSYLEVTAFCLTTHLEFREVLPTSGYLNLSAFCRDFGARDSVQGTAYRFDP